MERLAEVAREGMRTDIPAFEPGDTVRFTATKPGPLRVSVIDLDHSDNTGELDVIIRRLG